MTRAFLKSNVEKSLNDNTIVLFDSLNYIKGILNSKNIFNCIRLQIRIVLFSPIMQNYSLHSFIFHH